MPIAKTRAGLSKRTFADTFTVLDSAHALNDRVWYGTPTGVPIDALKSIVLSNSIASADDRAPWTCTARIGDDVRTARIVRITKSNDDLHFITKQLRRRYDDVFTVDGDKKLGERRVVCALKPRLTIRDLRDVRVGQTARGIVATHKDGARLELPRAMSDAAQCDALMRFAAERAANGRLQRGAAWLEPYRAYIKARAASVLAPGGVLKFYQNLPPDLDRAARKAKSWVRAHRTQINNRVAALAGGPFDSRLDRVRQAIAQMLPTIDVLADGDVLSDLAGFCPYGSPAS